MHSLSRLAFTSALAGISFAFQVQSGPTFLIDCTHLHAREWAPGNGRGVYPESQAANRDSPAAQLKPVGGRPVRVSCERETHQH